MLCSRASAASIGLVHWVAMACFCAPSAPALLPVTVTESVFLALHRLATLFQHTPSSSAFVQCSLLTACSLCAPFVFDLRSQCALLDLARSKCSLACAGDLVFQCSTDDNGTCSGLQVQSRTGSTKPSRYARNKLTRSQSAGMRACCGHANFVLWSQW
jgi:hypothetical protein